MKMPPIGIKKNQSSGFLQWQSCRGRDFCGFRPLKFGDPESPSMSPSELSSLKWGDDGELSPNDTLNLVERLMRVEEESKRADLNSSPIPQQKTPEDSKSKFA